jgi:hypothetical protein
MLGVGLVVGGVVDGKVLTCHGVDKQYRHYHYYRHYMVQCYQSLIWHNVQLALRPRNRFQVVGESLECGSRGIGIAEDLKARV